MALCPNCNDEMKVIPAGISRKTGKAYRSFEVCEKIACKALKEQSRVNVPYAAQNATQSSFNPLAPIVEDLQRKVDDLNVTISRMRTAFQNHEDRIKSLEHPTIDIPGFEGTKTSENQDHLKIDFPEGFLK